MAILIPRLLIVLFWLILRIFDRWFIIFKEVVTEGLMIGVIIQVYIFYMGDFVGDLDLKVAIGWNLLYCVLTIMIFHAVSGTIVIWLLLKDLETTLPEEYDPSMGLQK